MVLDDIEGISPSIYNNKILMKDDVKPVIKHKRRLNLKMKM